MTDAEWIYQGTRVAVYAQRYGLGSVCVETVERLTRTQIVLSNGQRFRRSDLREVVPVSSWKPPAELKPLDDPRVIDARAAKAVRSLVVSISEADADRVDSLESARTVLAEISNKVQKTQAILDRLAALAGEDA